MNNDNDSIPLILLLVAIGGGGGVGIWAEKGSKVYVKWEKRGSSYIGSQLNVGFSIK